MKNSTVYELWEDTKKDVSLKQKLDAHLKEVNAKYIPLSPDLVNFKIGNQITADT